MTRIQDLDKVLLCVRNFSKDLANVETTDMSKITGIEIDMLEEYLDELKKREYISFDSTGSYISLRGRIAIENSKKNKPFQDELNNVRLKKVWTVIKIIAGVLNSFAIIGIAIWTQYSNTENTKLKARIELLDLENKKNKSYFNHQTDSLENVINCTYTKFPLDTMKIEIK